MSQFKVGDKVVRCAVQRDGRTYSLPETGTVARVRNQFDIDFIYLEGNDEGYYSWRFQLAPTPVCAFKPGDRVKVKVPQPDGLTAVCKDGVVAYTEDDDDSLDSFVYLVGQDGKHYAYRFELDTTPVKPATKRVRLVVTPKDIRNKSIMDTSNCPIALALKRQVKKGVEIAVGGTDYTLKFNGKRYDKPIDYQRLWDISYPTRYRGGSLHFYTEIPTEYLK